MSTNYFTIEHSTPQEAIDQGVAGLEAVRSAFIGSELTAFDDDPSRSGLIFILGVCSNIIANASAELKQR